MMRCPYCSTEIPETAMACPNCQRGFPVSSEEHTIDSDAGPLRRPETPASSSGSRRGSPRASDRGGFVPGQMLQGRFRIVSLIGRGGMGEVYRADDLHLDQQVALKFLPRELVNDPVALERFRGEVRNARHVAHPNVCRMYDIGEHEGRVFLSMEYVDGEDLSSLLRRIGRLPSLKANEIAQQICAGLTAAHARGVLHRDLKPANILIDSKGEAHITDFGLALRSGEDSGGISGTPAYMAPEQFEGEAISERTDIYALGLILYEIYLGKRPFDAPNFAEWKSAHVNKTPARAREVSNEIDPAVEAVIAVCLEKDPLKRPASAIAVSAALPGGNALAAVLAAGETPSPELVAASGEEGTLTKTQAALLFGGIVLCLTVLFVLGRFSQTMNLYPPGKSPDYLVDRAKELATKLGGAGEPADYSWWFTGQENADYLLAKIPSPARYREIASLYPGILRFGYRQSPRPLQSPGYSVVRRITPAPFYSGEVSITLGLDGRLLYFSKIPPEKTDAANEGAAAKWDGFRQAAELSPELMKTIPTTWAPDVGSDRLYSWRSSTGKSAFEVHAASYRGVPVFFKVVGAEEPPTRIAGVYIPRGSKFGAALFAILATMTIVFCVYFARKNWKLGRIDSRGVFRAVVFVTLCGFTGGLFVKHFIPDASYAWQVWTSALAGASGIGVQIALFYLALEPYIRRQCPEILVSLTRLVGGKPRDPLVGRDLAFGIFTGMLSGIVLGVPDVLPYFFSVKGITSSFNAIGYVPAHEFIGTAIGYIEVETVDAIGMTALFFIVLKLVKRKSIAAILVGIVWASLLISGVNLPVEITSSIIVGLLVAFVIARLGPLALIAQLYTITTISAIPLSIDFNRWYAMRSVTFAVCLLVVAGFFLKMALGTVPLLGGADE